MRARGDIAHTAPRYADFMHKMCIGLTVGHAASELVLVYNLGMAAHNTIPSEYGTAKATILHPRKHRFTLMLAWTNRCSPRKAASKT
jgi:hypothetical protein